MRLTSLDETDLLMPLYAGMHEEPRFATFLERLKRRTDASYIGLVFRQGEVPIYEATELFAGWNLRERTRAVGVEELFRLDPIPYNSLRPGRVYSAAEFADRDPNPNFKDLRESYQRLVGITDERVVRIAEADRVSAWLVMARTRQCSATDSALLSAIAPHVGVALRSFVIMEQQRLRAAMSAEVLHRSGTGWILFDRQARIIDLDPASGDRIEALTRIRPRIGERLRTIEPQAERALIEAAAGFAREGTCAVRCVTLSHAPRLDALLLKTTVMPAAALSLPVMVALLRLPVAPSLDRAALLSALFDLPRREAELAMALSDGLSIAEAASSLGLSLETIRNYSKRLYAKLGVRGRTDLVRLIQRSSVNLV